MNDELLIIYRLGMMVYDQSFLWLCFLAAGYCTTFYCFIPPLLIGYTCIKLYLRYRTKY